MVLEASAKVIADADYSIRKSASRLRIMSFPKTFHT